MLHVALVRTPEAVFFLLKGRFVILREREVIEKVRMYGFRLIQRL